MELLATASGTGPDDAQLSYKGQPRDVKLTTAALEITLPGRGIHIPTTEIFAVECTPITGFPWVYDVEVHSVKRKGKKKAKWGHKVLQLKACSREVAERWTARIRELIHNDTERPRALRIFVNPFGGHGKGIELYQVAKKVFDLAHIQQDFTITDHANQIFEAVSTEDLAAYDGVVVVGGDGSYSEAVYGMLSRTDGLRLPVGTVPSGSTNTVAWTQMGTDDPTTCALHVVVGNKMKMDLGEVSLDGGKPRFLTNFLSHGFFSQLLEDSEKHRWMGPSRYTYSGTRSTLKSTAFNGTVTFTRVGGGDPITVEGPFQSVSAGVIALKSRKTRPGFVPQCGLNDGVMTLANREGLSFVDSYDVESFTYTAGEEVVWNFDGEIARATVLTARILPQAITVFGRRPEDGPAERALGPAAGAKSRTIATSTSDLTHTVDSSTDPEVVSTASTATDTADLITVAAVEAQTSPPPETKEEGMMTEAEPVVETKEEGIMTEAEPAVETKEEGMMTEAEPVVETKEGETSTLDLVDLCDGECQATVATAESACQWVEPPRQFGIPIEGCGSASCNRDPGRFPCFSGTCPYRGSWVVEAPPVFKMKTMPRKMKSDIEQEILHDPFEILERFVQQSKIRLVDVFKNVGRGNMNGAAVPEFKRRIIKLGIKMSELQMDELCKRLDRDNDGRITYRDLVVTRRKYTQRMKAHDPKWKTVRQYEDEQHHSGSFMVRPKSTSYYPPV